MSYLRLKELLLEHIKREEYHFRSIQEELIKKAETLLLEQHSSSSTEFASILVDQIALSRQAHFCAALISLIQSYESNTPFKQPENQYLILLRKEQKLKKELFEVQDDLKLLQTICTNEIKLKKFLKSNEESLTELISILNPQYQELVIHEKNIYRTWSELRAINPNNLRFVVLALIHGEGLTIKQFSDKIGYSEHEIYKLTHKGEVSMELLDTICSYFNIEKTEAFVHYVQTTVHN